MAQFGAKRPIFAPTKTTPDNALPTYDYEKVVTVGKLVKADLTVTNASGELYADDALAEKVDMFASGSLALETDDKTDEVHAAIHGATKDTQSSEVTDSDGDVAPRGGLCYYKVIIRGGVRYFKGVFHPLVKAILGNDSAATKGSSITSSASAGRSRSRPRWSSWTSFAAPCRPRRCAKSSIRPSAAFRPSVLR